DTTAANSALTGTPPCRRGGRVLGVGHGVQGRNTPASAGRTASARSPRLPAAEHPRVGGEDYAPARTTCSLIGTPPRRRGGLLAEAGEALADRNTPASAGRTA